MSWENRTVGNPRIADYRNKHHPSRKRIHILARSLSHIKCTIALYSIFVMQERRRQMISEHLHGSTYDTTWSETNYVWYRYVFEHIGWNWSAPKSDHWWCGGWVLTQRQGFDLHVSGQYVIRSFWYPRHKDSYLWGQDYVYCHWAIAIKIMSG